MKIKLIKIQELEDALHPNNIKEGFEIEGILYKEPTIGESFYVNNYWSTSAVKEIIDNDTFKTYSSIYKIIRL